MGQARRAGDAATPSKMTRCRSITSRIGKSARVLFAGCPRRRRKFTIRSDGPSSKRIESSQPPLPAAPARRPRYRSLADALPRQPLVQDTHAAGPQRETIRIRLNPARHGRRVAAGLAEDHDAERMRIAHLVEPQGDLDAMARRIHRLVAQVHRRTVALPDQRVERQVQVRPAQTSSAPGDSSAQNRRAKARPSWSSRVRYGCDASQAIMPRPTATSPRPTPAPAPPFRPRQPRQQHRRAEARHQDDRRGDVLHRPRAAAIGVTTQKCRGQPHRERREQQSEDRLRSPPHVRHDRRDDQRRGHCARPDVTPGGVREHLAGVARASQPISRAAPAAETPRPSRPASTA